MDSVATTLRQSLKRLSFRRSRSSNARKGKDDELSNAQVQYRGVSVSFLQSLVSDLLTSRVASDVNLYVVTDPVQGIAGEGMTVCCIDSASESLWNARIRGKHEIIQIPKESVSPKERKDWTLADVLDFIVLEETNDQYVPYVNMVDRKGKFLLGKPFQGAYVVCAKETRFVTLVRSIVLECMRKNKRLDKQFVWLDIFSVNYAQLEENPGDKSKLIDTIPQAIELFDTRWVFIDSWEDPKVLTRLWCAWEVHQMAQAKTPAPNYMLRPRKGEKAPPSLPLALAALDEEEEAKEEERRKQGSQDGVQDGLEHLEDDDEDEEEALLDKGRIDAILRTLEYQRFGCASTDDVKMIKNTASTADMKKSLIEQCKLWLVQSTITTLSKLRSKHAGQELASLLEQTADLILFTLKDDADNRTEQQKHQRYFHAAVKYYMEALSIYSKKKNDVRVASTVTKVATVYEDLKEYDHALAKYKKAFMIHKAKNDAMMVAKTLSKIANIWALKGKYDKALENYEQACLLMILIKDKDPLLVADTIVNTANILAYMKRFDQALKKFEQALLIRREKLGNLDPSVADVLNSIANVQASQGKLDEALEHYQKALEIYERAFGEQHMSVFVALNNIAVVLNDQGQSDEALEILHQAMALIAPGSRLSTKSNAAASQQSRRSSVQSAISAMSGNIRTIDSIPDVGTTYNNMAVCLEALKQYDKAMEKYQQALDLYREQLGSNHPKVANILLNMGVCLLESQNKKPEAATVLREALAIYTECFGDSHPDTKECKAFLKKATDK